jgi:hypothetical protein
MTLCVGTSEVDERPFSAPRVYFAAGMLGISVIRNVMSAFCRRHLTLISFSARYKKTSAQRYARLLF